MKKEEVIIRIISNLDLVYGDVINQQNVKDMLDKILYDYDVCIKETALAPLNNMQEMIMLYLTSCKIEGLSDNTLESYGRNLARFAKDVVKNVEDVTSMDIRLHLLNYSKTGVKNSTIATRTDIIRGFFGWLQSEGYINQQNPMNKIKTIKAESRIREPLSYEELEVLRTGAKTLRQKAILEMLYSTSVRLSGLVGMDIRDVDWNQMQIRVIEKGNKERTVYFNARAKIFLKKYINSRSDDCPALFVTERKPISRLSNRGVQRELKKIERQSGISRGIYPHLLRHTSASHMLDKGISLDVISEILGHSDISTTRIYAKTSQANVEYEYRRYMAN